MFKYMDYLKDFIETKNKRKKKLFVTEIIFTLKLKSLYKVFQMGIIISRANSTSSKEPFELNSIAMYF